ncbi:hypothetical protein F4678DRAFT_478216 [Xylaria arbuscula]|nr:hypothetical protein F4678DRAFT_478216 [Xylaria arbuscula]
MFKFWPFSRPSLPAYLSDNYQPTEESDCDPYPTEPEISGVDATARTTYIYGYPSSGGALIVTYCNGVELEFLGLPRFEQSQRSQDPAAEDRHCQRMRMLGAWMFEGVHEYGMMELFEPERIRNMPVVVAAWPQNGKGVWVFIFIQSQLNNTSGMKYIPEIIIVICAVNLDSRSLNSTITQLPHDFELSMGKPSQIELQNVDVISKSTEFQSSPVVGITSQARGI